MAHRPRIYAHWGRPDHLRVDPGSVDGPCFARSVSPDGGVEGRGDFVPPECRARAAPNSARAEADRSLAAVRSGGGQLSIWNLTDSVKIALAGIPSKG